MEQVAKFLEDLQLHGVTPAFQRDAVDGDMLIHLNEQELRDELGCTPLQAKKILKAVQKEMGETQTISTTKPSIVASPRNTPPPVQDILGRFDVPDLTKFKQLSDDIQADESEGIATKLAAAQQKANALHNSLVSKLQYEDQVVKDAAEAQKHVEKKEGWYLGKNLMSKEKVEGKLTDAQHSLQEKEDKLKTAHAASVHAKEALDDAKQEAESLRRRADTMSARIKSRDELRAKMFSASQWESDTCISSGRQIISDLGVRMNETAGHSRTYGHAADLLRNALQRASGAHQRLRGMMGLGAVDMMRPMGRGRGANVGQMMMLRRANDELQMAAAEIVKARDALPSLPWPPGASEEALKAARLGLFQNMIGFGGMGSDMVEMAMIRRSMRQVEQLVQQLQQALQWVDNNCRAFAEESSQMRAELSVKELEMKDYQEAQITAALKQL